jgi:hypothetical protein
MNVNNAFMFRLVTITITMMTWTDNGKVNLKKGDIGVSEFA